MRSTLFIFSLALLISCNSSSKEDPNKAMDDTARMDNPPPAAPAPIETTRIAAADIPASIKVKGKVQDAWKWNDNLGENILITTYVAPYDDKEKNKFGEEGQTAEIHAYHYAKKVDAFEEVWALDEEEKSCPFDITSQFIPNSTTVTDLDKNGIAEIKLQYALACRSDVSPAAMKLVIYENGVKYGLNGLMWLKYSPEFKFTVTEKDVNLDGQPELKDESEAMLRSFGRYDNEKQFGMAPPEFLTYARKEWIKYVIEKMGE